jgi:hypothetical protein
MVSEALDEGQENSEKSRPRIRVRVSGAERVKETGTSQSVSQPVPEEEQAPQLEIVRYPYMAG